MKNKYLIIWYEKDSNHKIKLCWLEKQEVEKLKKNKDVIKIEKW